LDADKKSNKEQSLQRENLTKMQLHILEEQVTPAAFTYQLNILNIEYGVACSSKNLQDVKQNKIKKFVTYIM
jgi:peptide methionine sulfoxide reductase MsrB